MNLLHVYTGSGKGKTTAAMGLALRSIGHGNQVLIAQFMKDGCSGELTALRTFENAHVLCAEPISGFTFRMSPTEKELAARQQTEFARQLLQEIPAIQPVCIILDELGVAVSSGLLDDALAGRIIDLSLQFGETVTTGRTIPDWLREKADYLSVISAEKHPYASRQIPAREGVEW